MVLEPVAIFNQHGPWAVRVSPTLATDEKSPPAPAKAPFVFRHHELFHRIKALRTSEKIRLVLMYIYTTHIISNAIAGSFRTGSLMYIIETLTYTIRCVAATLSFSYVCFNDTQWEALHAELSRTGHSELVRRFALKRTILRVLVVCYSSMLIVTTALFFVLVPAQKYFDKCFYGLVIKERGIPEPLAILIGLTEWNWYNILVSTSPLLITDLIQMADLMRAQIRDYRTTCRRVGIHNINQLQEATVQLTSLMQRLDSFYSPLLFLWSLDLLTNVVLPIRTVINGIASFTIANVMNFFIEASYSISFFFTMSFALAEIDKESRTTQEEIYNLRIAIPDSPAEFVTVYSKFSLLESGLAGCKFTLSGMGLFEVDRSFILTLAGAVTTYTIVLMQLAPGDTY